MKSKFASSPQHSCIIGLISCDTGVKADAEWSLFCPNEAPRLCETYGKEFEELYEKYERQGKARKVISAQKLWFSILDSQIETGMPYILYKGERRFFHNLLEGLRL